MIKKIVLATGNQGKVKELNQMLADAKVQILAQSEFNVTEADETGLTFVENAILKARNACKQTGLPAIADDSGLEVDYLNGAPGIYSARYAGENANDQDNLQKLLTELKDVPALQRSARFQCVLVYMRHENDPTPLICQGSWEGQIIEQPQGDNGFGYDPIFWLEAQNCTSAQLPPQTKNMLSHRGQALALLKQKLGQIL
ncbi:XTP/dITP diphosphatase [Catenovulum sp. 2E275]|uniref:XTP/dITP diphosphatase n=1 Tax=Catenovulum sp. 2E275 TaxID=2980497 RepID=UPI0021D25BD8|nr:XTP/dITP diphosphatase [Catenovulum sp. 2E275]MCU4675977.1 XTP/dITP diphosphatase [Catenovulum sp. 2E275]